MKRDSLQDCILSLQPSAWKYLDQILGFANLEHILGFAKTMTGVWTYAYKLFFRQKTGNSWFRWNQIVRKLFRKIEKARK